MASNDKKEPESKMVTTENEYAENENQPRTRELNDKDRANIVKEFNEPGANVAAIAGKYEVEPSEVFALVDKVNAGKNRNNMSHLSQEEIENVKHLYQTGKGTIQDYARIYRVPVAEILDILDMSDLKTVHFGGDLIDEQELGPTGRGQVNYGEDVEVPFSTN